LTLILVFDFEKNIQKKPMSRERDAFAGGYVGKGLRGVGNGFIVVHALLTGSAPQAPIVHISMGATTSGARAPLIDGLPCCESIKPNDGMT